VAGGGSLCVRDQRELIKGRERVEGEGLGVVTSSDLYLGLSITDGQDLSELGRCAQMGRGSCHNCIQAEMSGSSFGGKCAFPIRTPW